MLGCWERRRCRPDELFSGDGDQIILNAAISWHFERDPIPYALETDWPVGAAGFEPLHLKIGIAKTLSSGREDIDYSENLRVLTDELRANAAKNGEQS
jgi:hypothetical protein